LHPALKLRVGTFRICRAHCVHGRAIRERCEQLVVRTLVFGHGRKVGLVGFMPVRIELAMSLRDIHGEAHAIGDLEFERLCGRNGGSAGEQRRRHRERNRKTERPS
jgi:hypothetical protein